MAGWSKHNGKALALLVDNIDTDQLIPARFMSVPRSEGYGPYLLHDMRRDSEGNLIADFPLNRHAASILVCGRNFGSGSSREAAVYALVDAGIKAVAAPSFGDIFANNAVNNGLLPACVSEPKISAIANALGGGTGDATISLESGMLTVGETSAAFDLDESWRIKLMNGWDDIDLTLRHEAEITEYKQNRIQTSGWAWPAAEG